MYKNFLLFTIVSLVLSFAGCKKGEVIQTPAYTRIAVESMLFADVPQLAVFVNDTEVGQLDPGVSVSKLLPKDASVSFMTLVIKDAVSGELYLDSVFQPQHLNAFKILVDNTLGIRQFMKQGSDNTDPIPNDYYRVQLVNKIKKNGVEKRVTFKLFRDSVNTFVNLKELEEKFENVGYGEMSEARDIQILYFKRSPSPVAPRFARNIHIQAVDAVTGEVLVEVQADGLMAVNKNKHSILAPVIVEDPQTNLLTWSNGNAWPRVEL